MSLTQANAEGPPTDTPAVPVALTAALAKLVLLRHSKELPEPSNIRTWGDSIDVEVNGNLDDFRYWRKALGGKADQTTVYDFGDSGIQHEVMVRDWAGTGWRIDLQCNLAHGPRTSPIDDDTALGLMAAAS